MKIKYTPHRFGVEAKALIATVNEILEEYTEQGYDLTLRQVYYQLVSRDLIPNDQKQYKRLGDVISAARRAGLIDWEHIVDRTRSLKTLSSWDSPADIIAAVAEQFRIDPWEDQLYRVECYVEKDALVGILRVACEPLRVPYLACRGYGSDSEMWRAGRRLKQYVADQNVVILHLGDHDPSGIDMTRDIEAKLRLFAETDYIEVRRLALNMNQVHQYNPPPNFAKETDSRHKKYKELFGESSWELDALNPTVITALIQDEVNLLIDREAWDASMAREEQHKADLAKVSHYWDSVVEHARNAV